MFDDLDNFLDLDYEVPEFRFGERPKTFRPFSFMSAEEWHHIEQAALFAHRGRTQPAERARELGGYAGLNEGKGKA